MTDYVTNICSQESHSRGGRLSSHRIHFTIGSASGEGVELLFNHEHSTSVSANLSSPLRCISLNYIIQGARIARPFWV